MKIEKRCTGEVILELSCDTLKNANLRGANLRWAALRWADLRGADLRGADLRGAFVMLGGMKFFLTEEPKQ